MAVKQIPIDSLTVGMYVVGLDRPWPEGLRLANKHRVERREEVALLKKLGVLQVTVDPTLGMDVAEESLEQIPRQLVSLSRELAIARTVRAEAASVMEGIFEGIKTGMPINSQEVKNAVRSLMHTILRLHAPLLGLIHMQRADINMFTHAMNVCSFALVVGKNQGFDKVRLEHLGIGAVLHDVGELRLPRNLFRKQSIYTDPERRLVQQHPLLGAAILSQSSDIHEESYRIVLEHHERPDGSGYPKGLRGLDISPLSEIVGIVDMYDAMISYREGRPPLAPSQAIKEVYQYGLKGHVDLNWAERVIRCLGIYPIGSLVQLSTGERGIVVAANPLDALRPSVQIISDARSQPHHPAMLVDLAVPREGEPERTILRALNPDQENICVASYVEEVSSNP